MSVPSIPTVVGATAAVVAGISYLDARLSLWSDVNLLLSRRAALAEMTKAARKGRTSFYYVFEDAVKRKGDAEAIWSHGECLSFNQAYDRVHQYAQWFLSQGVGPGTFVVFYMLNSPDFICAWLGLLAAGAAPAMVNTNLASKGLVHCVAISEAKLVLADGDDEMLGRLDGVRSDLEARGHRIVKLRDIHQQVLGLPAVRPADELRRAAPAHAHLALAYTSGTTGLPKAISFPTLIFTAATLARNKGYSPLKGDDQRCYDCMPYYHMTGGLSALQTLGAGHTLCIAPKFRASTFWADIRAARATYFIYVGEVLRYLLAQPPSPLDRAHGVHTISGNGLRADVWEPFRARFGVATICEFYNSTEAMFGLHNPNRGPFTARALGLHGALLRWLHRGDFAAAAVDPETGNLARDPATGRARRLPLADGGAGELLVRLDPGSGAPGRDFRGYWRDDDATGRKLARGVFRDGDCYYRTGDALRRDADGRWFFCDRLGDTFRWKGENVSTTEVADALGDFPGVVDANVYGVQLAGHEGRAGAVALVLEEDKRADFDLAGFLRHCRSRLPRYAVPVFIRFTDASYSTGSHKQNKVPLKTEGVDPAQVSNGDVVYWIDRQGKGDTYIPFTEEDWKTLQAGKARL